ncbi:hypothetical protein [Sulfitobacter pacificus]|uniref:hypothetical protein n=1 Tax=Sulfitobacter pacificus TaxID=1499314 RepID=UPI0031065977
MTKSKTTAKAAPKAMPKTITALRIKPAKIGDMTTPCAFIKGDAPRAGTKITFTLKGQTYSGIVATADEIDGETRVSFKDGIAATK